MPQGTPDTSRGLTPDLNRREIGILVPIALACVLIGVYPKALQSSIDPTIMANVFHQSETPLADAGEPAALDDHEERIQ